MLYTKKFVFTVSLCAMLAVNPVWAVTNPVEAKAAAKSGTPGVVSTVYSDWTGRATSGIAGVSYVNNAVDAAGNAAQWAENHAAAAAQSAKSAAGSASDAAKVLEKAVLRPDEVVKEGTAVGSKTLPVYVNADGTVATITSYQGKAATAGTADKAKADINGAQIDTTYEKLSNKVTTLSADSTDTQYPSAKAVYTELGKKQDELTTTNIKGAGSVSVAIADGVITVTGTDNDTKYTLPAATSSTLGGVKTGTNITNNSGTISVNTTAMPAANSGVPFTAGGAYTELAKKQDKLTTSNIKGAGSVSVAIADGVITVTGTDNDTKYTLPNATTSVKGGVIVGDNINVSSGKISVPAATSTTLGVVKQGTNITIADDGTISAKDTVYTLPDATKTTKGGVIVGDNINVASGKISVNTTATPAANSGVPFTAGGAFTELGKKQDKLTTSNIKGAGSVSVAIADGVITVTGTDNDTKYTLPNATTSVKGGVIVGDNINVSSGKISVPAATSTTLGVVKQGTNITIADDGTISAKDTTYTAGTNVTITNGVISAKDTVYTLPDATKTGKGGVIVGDNINVSSGKISVPAATSTTLGVVKQGTNITIADDGTISAKDTVYTLPAATSSALGGVKTGTNITNNSGTISVNTTATPAANSGVPFTAGGAFTELGKKQDKLTTSNIKGAGSVSVAIADGVITVTGTDNDTKYTLPNATTSVKGGVIVGDNINVASGKISVPAATSTTLGVVKPGTNITNNSGTISVNITATPAANSGVPFTAGGAFTELGKKQDKLTTSNIKGAGSVSVAIADGVITVTGTDNDTKYTLPAATSSALGGVKTGTNITNSSGTISVATANGTTLGVVKQGTNTTISNGAVNVATANGATLGVVKQGTNTTISNGAVNVANATATVVGVSKLGVIPSGNDKTGTAEIWVE